MERHVYFKKYSIQKDTLIQMLKHNHYISLEEL